MREFSRNVMLTDLALISAAVFATHFLWFGADRIELHVPSGAAGDITIEYWLVSVGIVVVWMAALAFSGSRDSKILGMGMTEYRRLGQATLSVFGLIAIVMFLLKSELGRGYFLTALPAGLAALMLGRYLLRRWLNARREAGEFLVRALLVGDREKTEHVVHGLSRDPSTGFTLVGALTPEGPTITTSCGGVPVLGDVDSLIDQVHATNADTVIFTGSDALGPRRMRELGWKLDELRVGLIVAPSLTDIAGPRIHAAPVAGQPLIMVDYPSLEGYKGRLKRAFDLFGAMVLIVLSAPVLLFVALSVKASSPGPVLYRQERVGHGGRSFFMLKFRSMVVDADSDLEALLAKQGTAGRPLFKVTDDPRITPIGRFLRKYSLDELPQFFNVLKGDMSLVGPRPQRPAEVKLYDEWASRRLLVTPGITGLWQVSGRSDLSWDDTVRLDLYYVENWSLTGDIIILWRTVRAVLAPNGAY
jgi:exopolysaccharide biosynthesis polyprenyl glycosylphosphotransferase